MKLGTAQIIQGNALNLPLPDSSVDLICTSPPYFGLRSYQDGCRTCTGSPDSYRVKTCSGCGETTSRVKCHNGCDAPMKWTKPEQPFTAECPDCGGTGKGHYDGQIGSEATPAEFLEALLAATREMVRVLKPSGSIFVNLGDKYAGSDGSPGGAASSTLAGQARAHLAASTGVKRRVARGAPTKSLIGIPWRYAIQCIDNLGLILRAEIIWAKPNGLPESVTDRVRRSHEQWFHFVRQPRYFAAVDEIREPHTGPDVSHFGRIKTDRWAEDPAGMARPAGLVKAGSVREYNPLGKLPGSVWSIPTQPLTVPPELGVDHFAAYPMEWPRRIIQGWTPNGVCTVCGEGRRPVTQKDYLSQFIPGEDYEAPDTWTGTRDNPRERAANGTFLPRDDYVNKGVLHGKGRQVTRMGDGIRVGITGYMCGCPTPNASTTPSVVCDPFGGTGTTALVAKALGRTGITIDLSSDYCRLAEWRCNDPRELAAALQVEKPDPVHPDQLDLFSGIE